MLPNLAPRRRIRSKLDIHGTFRKMKAPNDFSLRAAVFCTMLVFVFFGRTGRAGDAASQAQSGSSLRI
jgi:hypothetical protein